MQANSKQMILLAVLLNVATAGAFANNLKIENLKIVPHNSTTAYFKFDISWDNSWRFPAGNDPLYFHDAVWVFFKIQAQGQSAWEHVYFEGTGTNPPDYYPGAGTGIELVVPEDRVGFFVRRSASAVGKGTNSVQGVKVVWNFAANGLTVKSKVNAKVFGVEMVYVAEGPFWVGDGLADTGQLYEGGGGTNSFQITDAGPITCGNTPGCLWGASQSGNTSMGGVGIISSNFPNGYNAFYCMKYEITQGQYKDFLNALTRDQQAARCTATTWSNYMSNAAGGSTSIQARNTVQCVAEPAAPDARTYDTETPDRVCNWLNWDDLAAFLDWSGLRPMTELEYEKSCRGPLTPVAGEYAWGNIVTHTISGLQGTDGSGAEYYNTGNLHVSGNGGPSGPVRAGIFARSGPGSTREASGAGYWGSMELSGNVYERSVTIGHAQGRAFTGLHGDGKLTVLGAADVGSWPVGGAGAGLRGSAGTSGALAYARASDRVNAASAGAARNNYCGGRGGRSAASGVGP